MPWRTDKNDNRFKIESGESGIQEAADNIVNERPLEQTPGICGFCGSGAETGELPDGRYICESCLRTHFEEVLAQLNVSESELLERLEREIPSTPTVQPKLVDDAKKCGRCGMTIQNYGKGGSREHWQQYHANEVV